MNKNVKIALRTLSKNRLKDVKRNRKIIKDGIFIIDKNIKQKKGNSCYLAENWKWFCNNLLPPADVNAITRWSDGDIVGKLLDKVE